MKKISGLLLMGCSALALAGCGADDISSPGSDSINVPITNPTPAPTPTPGAGLVQPAADCPAIGATRGLTNSGTITGPEGTWRVCTLPSLIDSSTTLPKLNGVLYRMNGRVDVGCDGGLKAPTTTAPFATTTANCGGRSLSADTNVTLTIEPGVIVYGENGAEPAWLAVNRGNKINASGTLERPIIFTTYDNVRGTATDATDGRWGGVVLMGRGITTDCTAGGSTTNQTCERDTEGSSSPAVFGGADNTYNAGIMRYVQIRYSGYVLGNNIELQALTGEGLGTGTTLEYIQSVNSSDDGAEFFGGAVNMKHYIAVNADDDSLDIDSGLQGNFQYVIIAQRAADGDSLMEVDSNNNEEQLPRQKSIVANFTAIQPGVNNNSNNAAIFARGNSDLTLLNGVVYAPQDECIRLNATGTTPATLKAHSVVMSCSSAGAFLGTGTGYSNASVKAQFDAGTNNSSTFTSTLANTFVNGANESGVQPFTNYASLNASGQTNVSSFFTVTDYIGAVKNAADVWFRGWTCDNATANFGSGKLCTALPVT